MCRPAGPTNTFSTRVIHFIYSGHKSTHPSVCEGAIAGVAQEEGKHIRVFQRCSPYPVRRQYPIIQYHLGVTRRTRILGTASIHPYETAYYLASPVSFNSRPQNTQHNHTKYEYPPVSGCTVRSIASIRQSQAAKYAAVYRRSIHQ